MRPPKLCVRPPLHVRSRPHGMQHKGEEAAPRPDYPLRGRRNRLSLLRPRLEHSHASAQPLATSDADVNMAAGAERQGKRRRYALCFGIGGKQTCKGTALESPANTRHTPSACPEEYANTWISEHRERPQLPKETVYAETPVAWALGPRTPLGRERPRQASVGFIAFPVGLRHTRCVYAARLALCARALRSAMAPPWHRRPSHP